jgi:hypothetical protein
VIRTAYRNDCEALERRRHQDGRFTIRFRFTCKRPMIARAGGEAISGFRRSCGRDSVAADVSGLRVEEQRRVVEAVAEFAFARRLGIIRK